ncbi:MAG: DUF4345 family protein [Phyllobacteriaceae bacterium]|nr:DUF4345 family protein [Phyllobacteriaceae bacterium]
MEFYLPASPGEWLAWGSAAFTLALGLVAMFAPRIMLKVMRLTTLPDRESALAEIRASYGGFRIGTGLACMLLHPQPLLYLALGAAWIATAFGRLLSMLSDKGMTVFNWLYIVVELGLAAAALSYALGLVA